jgi:phosphoenolpyruvate carboxylase
VKPTVIDEVKNGLFYFESGLFDLIPRLYRELEYALRTAYPDHAVACAASVALRSVDGRRP